MAMNDVYNVIRYTRGGLATVQHTGVTLEFAQRWCNREDTHGADWFDGYRIADTRRVRSSLIERVYRELSPGVNGTRL